MSCGQRAHRPDPGQAERDRKTTKRTAFLAEMDGWRRGKLLCELIEWRS